jgi:hypothetical protein
MIENPNSRGWHAAVDIPLYARVKLVADSAYEGGFKLRLATPGEVADGIALNECKADTADNRTNGYRVATTFRRIGFDAEHMAIAGGAITLGDFLRAGPDGTLVTRVPAAITGVAAEADDDIVTKVAHGLNTGDPLRYDSGTGFTGLTATTTYFVIRLGADTFKLATTLANAIAGTAINISADGSSGVFTPMAAELAQALDTVASGKRLSVIYRPQVAA